MLLDWVDQGSAWKSDHSQRDITGRALGAPLAWQSGVGSAVEEEGVELPKNMEKFRRGGGHMDRNQPDNLGFLPSVLLAGGLKHTIHTDVLTSVLKGSEIPSWAVHILSTNGLATIRVEWV